MQKELFASHLGFDTWAHLINASEPIAISNSVCTWYVVLTNTWYKWVVWDTNFDMLYNHVTRKDALSALLRYVTDQPAQRFRWLNAVRGAEEFGFVG